jgi:hypothetical protein
MVVLTVVGGTGVVLGGLFGIRSPAELALAAYLLSFAELVALALLLSVFDAMTRAGLVTGAVLILFGAVGAALLVGTSGPSTLPRLRTLRAELRAGPVLAVAIIVGLAFAYVLALIIGTSPNGWDPLNYHLARAALWLEADHVGYIGSAYDERLNFNPPNAEIAVASLLGISRHEELAPVVQLASALACAVGVFCLGRRNGLRPQASLFGALLLLAMPIVLLQSSTAKNDLVVASFLVGAAVFVVGRSVRELTLAGVATALAVGVKFTAAYGVVLLLLMAVTAEPRTAWWKRLCAIGAGAGVGSYWYAVNAVESGQALGDQSNVPGLTAVFSPPEHVITAFGLMVDSLDLSGAVGADLFVFVVVAAALTSGLLLAARRGHDISPRGALLAGALVVVVLPIYALTTHAGRPALVWLYGALGSPHAYLAEGDDVATSATTASDTASWFGPAGLLLVVGIAVAAVVLVRRRALPLLAVITAGAPAAWLVLLALTLTYHPWQGRFFVFPVALSASLWGLTLRVPAIAWAMTALAGTTAALSLVHFVEKPSGVRLLEQAPASSVWSMTRAEVQSLHDRPLEPLLEYIERAVPADASIGLAFGANEFGYPVFDARLERQVLLVPWGSSAADLKTAWLVANPERAPEIDRTCWDERLVTDRGSVFARVPGGCDG